MKNQKADERTGFGFASHLQWLHDVSSAGGAPCGGRDHREASADVSPAIATEDQECSGRMEDSDAGHDGGVFKRFEGWRSAGECLVFADDQGIREYQHQYGANSPIHQTSAVYR